jgi:hypothetical protein
MKNVDDLTPEAIRKLRQAFGKMRNHKWWKKIVKGGVASIEVTNIGNGWHPHLHAVLDCRFLSKGVTEPPPSWSREEKAARYKEAAASVERVWAKLLKQPTAAIKIKRASGTTILKEVVKYSVKGSDLPKLQGKIGTVIHAMEHTRLLTTFGSVFGLGPTPEAEENQSYHKHPSKSEEPGETPTTCCSKPEIMPLDVFQMICRSPRGMKSVESTPPASDEQASRWKASGH